VSSIVGAGGRVIVIDDGYSFKNSCILQGGDFVEFSGDSEICLNPFSVIDAAAVEADQEYRESVMAMISGLVQQMCRVQTATDDLENSEIKEAIAKVWAAKGTSGEINDVGLQLEETGTPRTRDLASLLRPCMRGGIYERYWNGKCTLSINSPLSVFELSEIKARKDLQGLVMMMMMFLAAETMYHGDRGQKSAI
ncbi:MAG: hypothetical protein GY854_10050, partial [Deltaproteobacteria bacterium]|nr:hypothetical protein [Deltaproteobacteria bacterium]